MFEQMYDVSERTPVHFLGYASERNRFDLAIVYTDSFFGKPLVVCMQTGRSSLLSAEDVGNIEYLQRIYKIKMKEDAEELSHFLSQRLPSLDASEQY